MNGTDWLRRYGYVSEREALALSETTGEPDYVELAVALCRDNLPLFDVLFLGRDPAPHIPVVWKEIKDAKRVILELPRDHLKTARYVVSRRIHRICYASIGVGSNPRILILNETAGQADKTFTEIKSKLLQAHDSSGPRNLLGKAFGNFNERIIKSADGLLYFDLGQGVDRDPTIESVGYEGAITGGHPTDCSADDIDSHETSRTHDRRETRWTLWSGTFEGLFSPSTQVTLSCTPKHELDVRGRLKKTGFYQTVNHPALNRMPTVDDYEEVKNDRGTRVWVRLTPRGLGQVDGVEPLRALWPCPLGQCPGPDCADGQVPGIPFHRPSEYLIHAKFLANAYTFMTEFMLQHTTSAEAPIKKHMLRFYSFDDNDVGKTTEWNESKVVAFPPKEDIIASVHGWDHAIGESRKSDNTAMASLYRDKNNNIYCRVMADRWDPETVKRMMESQFATDPFKVPFLVVTEGISFQRMFGTGVQETARVAVPIHTEKRPVDKLGAMVQNGYLNQIYSSKVFFHFQDKDTINEHLFFTGGSSGGGLHDDRVDACRLAYGPMQSVGGIRPSVNPFPSRRHMMRTW